MITNLLNAVKSRWEAIFLAICFILVGVISFNLGKMSALQKTDITFGTDATIFNAAATSSTTSYPQQSGMPAISQPRSGRVVGSKNSDKYHYEWCSGAKRISLANQIWFVSAQEAEKAGYVLAGNCQ